MNTASLQCLRGTRLRACLLAALLLPGLPSAARAQDAAKSAANPPAVSSEKPVWVLAYFRQRYEGRVEIDANGQTRTVPLPNPMKEEQLHLALSEDGRHWVPLQGNRPVWKQWLRDPFVGRGADGRWHLTATGGGPGPRPGREAGPTCLYATSKDLIHWQDARSLTPMRGVTDETGRPARNIWAPEWIVDPASGDYVMVWSSSFEDAGWKRSRLWLARTKDWRTFTPAKALFAPPYSVIDGTLLNCDGTWFLFHKEEEFGATTGERRAIRLATAKRLEGPYTIFEGPLNQGQIVPVITEGPSVMLDPLKPGWLLLYDYCMTNGYGVSTSPDLTHWAIEEATSLPPDARHGSVARVTAAEAAALRAAFPETR